MPSRVSSRALLTWANVVVPVIFFAVVILGNLAIPNDQPPLSGVREPLFHGLCIVLIGSGAVAIAKVTVLGGFRWLAAVGYIVAMAILMTYAGAGVSFLMMMGRMG